MICSDSNCVKVNDRLSDNLFRNLKRHTGSGLTTLMSDTVIKARCAFERRKEVNPEAVSSIIGMKPADSVQGMRVGGCGSGI